MVDELADGYHIEWRYGRVFARWLTLAAGSGERVVHEFPEPGHLRLAVMLQAVDLAVARDGAEVDRIKSARRGRQRGKAPMPQPMKARIRTTDCPGQSFIPPIHRVRLQRAPGNVGPRSKRRSGLPPTEQTYQP